MNILTNLELEKKASNTDKTYSFGQYNASTHVLSGFSVDVKDESLYMVLDNHKGGIRATDAAQWKSFLEECKKDYKNAFIFLTSGIDDGFTDPAELSLFIETVSGLFERGKNTFVISRGTSAGVNFLNCVRYMTVQYDASIRASSFKEDSNRASICALLSGDRVSISYQYE